MRKILPLAFLVITGCGDTNNYYTAVDGGSGDGKSGNSINSCEEMIDKYYGCGLNEPDSDYNYLVNRCKNKGWLGTKWKSCFEAHGCEELANGVCDEYATL